MKILLNYLNTSYVEVKQEEKIHFAEFVSNLNTSYVEVKPKFNRKKCRFNRI